MKKIFLIGYYGYKNYGDDLLFKTNKWIVCHKDFERFLKMGAHEGLVGQNYKINY